MSSATRIVVAITRPGFHGYLAPLGYLYVVAALKKAGATVEAVNISLEDAQGLDPLRNALDQTRPDLVITGTSYKFHNNCPSPTIRQALSVSRCAKQWSPGCTTLLVGPLNAMVYDTLLRGTSVDAVALGEPEEICCDVARAVAERSPLSSISGLALQSPEGIELTGARPYPDLAALALPDRESIDFEDYICDSYFAPRTTDVLSSRGCPFDCTYCFGARTSRRNEFNSGRPFRAAPPHRVVEEMDLLYNRWGVRGIKFADVDFCVSKQRVAEICELLLSKGHRDLYWRVVTHVTSVEPQLLELMHRAGCQNIYYGAESGDEGMLRAMNKSVTIDQIRETFENTWRVGIKPEASFLLGTPGETERSVAKTIKFSLAINPFLATYHVFVPFPGIPLEAELRTVSDESLDDWNVYQPRGARSYCDIPAERLAQLARKAYRRFYLRPGYLVKMALRMRESSMRRYVLRLVTGRNEGSWLRRMLARGK